MFVQQYESDAFIINSEIECCLINLSGFYNRNLNLWLGSQNKIQMQLIPLNQTIYFNATEIGDISLSYIYLLAFTYHPIYSNLLYLLYRVTNSLYTPYSSLHLLVRDSNIGTFIQNNTLSGNDYCAIGCEIKVTTDLFLFESQTLALVYPIDKANNVVNLGNGYYVSKTINNYAGLDRVADIHADKFAFLRISTSTLVFGTASNGVVLQFPLTDIGSNILFIGLSQNEVYIVTERLSAKIYFYDCVSCIYNGSITNANLNKTFSQISTTFNIGISVSNYLRLYQGNRIYNGSLNYGKVYWLYNSGSSSRKYFINRTYLQQIQTILTFTYNSSANHQHQFQYGFALILSHNRFNYANETMEVYSYGSLIKRLEISNDSLLLAIQDDTASWKIKQYSVVSSCSYYDVNGISTNTLFCFCNTYNASTNRCNVLTSSSNASNAKGDSFPIAAVIGVVAGLVFIGISLVVIKKNYKRCTKGRRRTAWKYNPIDLMSFQA